MNVKSENKDTLYESFKSPEDSKKPAPLWFWNREVEDMTTKQVRELVRNSYIQSGYSGFGILPEWQKSYLTDEYFKLYEAALDEGSKYGMKFSLYDENGFPSYNAGGLLEEKYPELTTKRLDMIEKSANDGETVKLELPEGKLMGAVAMNTDTHERMDISDKAVIIAPPPFNPDDVPTGISASSTYSVSPGYDAQKAVDGNLSTRWNSESMSGGKQYLQIKYTEPKTFNTIKIYEDSNAALQRTRKYMVQYWDDGTGEWKDVAAGNTITDAGAVHNFAPVTAQIVRLYINRIEGDSASISEFQVLHNDEQLAVPPRESGATPGVLASSRYNPDYDAAFAFDGDFTTRWNAADATRPPHWLQMTFGSKKTVDSVKVYQSMNRISKFAIQYWSGSDWVTCYEGSEIGLDNTGSTFAFEPVETKMMRLYISETRDFNPSIWELAFYNGTEKLVPDTNSPEVPESETSYLEYTVPNGNWKVMAFMCVVDGRDGMDYLNAESVKAFIDITYEEYYKRFKKYFDNGTITSAFYDEPSFWPAGGRTPYGAEGARFWTMSFNEDYESYYHTSPVLDYPALFMDMGDATTEARDKFHYVRTELFANNYIGQLNKWCADHGIKLTGHMLFEEWVNPVGLQGDLMKCFKNQAIPGVDIISSYGYSQEAYKIISSSANNWDKPVVMSESFGVFQNTNMDNFYKSAMDQFAKGVSLIIPHAVWYDDDPKYVTYVPELSYRSADFGPNLPALNTFIARSHVMLQGGRHAADIGMLYPIDTLESEFYFNGQPNNPAYADYMQVSELLSLNVRRDFTYLHPDILDQKCTVEGSTIRLNNTNNYEQYQVMILPAMKVISLSNLQKIKAFYDAGGKVIATGMLPYGATRKEDSAKVKEILEDMFGVNPESISASDKLMYRSSSNYSGNYTATMAFDGVYGEGSRWNAGVNGAGQWIEVEFPKAVTINRTKITERFGRVQGYEIQYFDEVAQSYKSCVTGNSLGVNKTDNFTPVTTKKLRLYITKISGESVSIEEFEVYGASGDNLALDKSDIRLKNSNAAGGKVYFIDGNLSGNLAKALDDALAVYDVEIDGVKNLSGGYLSYIHKIKDGRNLYYFANSSDNTVDTTVQIRGRLKTPMLWDPKNGNSSAASYEYKTVNGKDVTEITLNLSAIDSVYVVEPPVDLEYISGDVDGDEKVNVSDVVALRRLIMAGNWSEQQQAAGDLDNDGTLTVTDVVELRRLIMKGVN